MPKNTPLDENIKAEIRQKSREELVADALKMQAAYDDLICAAEDLLDDPLSPRAWADLQNEALYQGNWREELRWVFRKVGEEI